MNGRSVALVKVSLAAAQNKVRGGLGDKRKASSFPADQMRKGIKVEMEHTNDKRVASEITRDHLTERDDYYDLLPAIEKEDPKKEREEALEKIEEEVEEDEDKGSKQVSEQTKAKARALLIRHLGKKLPDEKVHDLAEEQKTDTHELESYIYSLASQGAAMSTKRASVLIDVALIGFFDEMEKMAQGQSAMGSSVGSMVGAAAGPAAGVAAGTAARQGQIGPKQTLQQFGGALKGIGQKFMRNVRAQGRIMGAKKQLAALGRKGGGSPISSSKVMPSAKPSLGRAFTQEAMRGLQPGRRSARGFVSQPSWKGMGIGQMAQPSWRGMGTARRSY